MGHKKNKMKDELKEMLALNGRRLDWVTAQFGLSRNWFNIRLNLQNFTPEEWVKITDLVINGAKSQFAKPISYELKKPDNR